MLVLRRFPRSLEAGWGGGLWACLLRDSVGVGSSWNRIKKRDKKESVL